MNNKNNNKLQMLIQAGAVGLCILLIAVVVYQLKLNNELIFNHIGSSTQATIENTKVLEKLLGSVNRLSELLKHQQK